MNPRFQRDASNPKFVGASGLNASGSLDSTDTRRRFPDTTDGTLSSGYVFEDLSDGTRWFWDGSTWQPAVSETTLLIAAVNALKKELSDQNAQMIALLEDTRDALMSIAPR